MKLHEKWIHSKGGLNEDFSDEIVVAKEAFANMIHLTCGAVLFL